MTPSLFLSLLSGLALANAQAPSIDDYSEADIANGQAWADIVAIADRKIQSNLASRPDAVCTYANAEIRSEWRTLSSDTRQSFTDAVLCLQDLPPQVMTTVEAPSYPGIQTRYEEYVATHINYTLSIHGTADFFEWHRTFTHFFYRDLRDRCGYQGPMPYWDWSRDAAAPQDSELFSGDAASMGSNGVFIPDRPDTWLALQGVTYPPGTGGGCVTEGPFSNMTVRLGPLDTPNTPNVPTPFAANPRCLVRDLNPWFSSQYNTYENVTRLVLESIFVEDLQDRAEGFAPGDKFGVHGGGHWQVGGPMVSSCLARA